MRPRISPLSAALLACSVWLCAAVVHPDRSDPHFRINMPGKTPAQKPAAARNLQQDAVAELESAEKGECALHPAERIAALLTLTKAASPSSRVSDTDAATARAALFVRVNCLNEKNLPPDPEAQQVLCRSWALDLNPPDFDAPERLCGAFPGAQGRIQELGAGNSALALKRYEAAAAAQDQWAMTRLGVFNAYGVQMQPDYSKAAKLFGDAKNYPPANTQLGRMYELGLGLPQNSKKAAYWYEKAVKQGDPAAAGRLALLYSRGDGVPKDILKAQALFRKARNSKTAAYGAAMLLCAGPDNCPPQAEEALKAAAARGYETDFWPNGTDARGEPKYAAVKTLTPGLPEAQYALAQYALLVSSDVARAIALHEEAAAQGFAPSYARLAALYYEDGSPARLSKACTALSVIAQDKTAGAPPPTPGLSSYCNYLLLASDSGGRGEAALIQLKAAVSACASGACPPAFRELVSSKINAITEAENKEKQRHTALYAPPPESPAKKRAAPNWLIILTGACALGAFWALTRARGEVADKDRRLKADASLSGIKSALAEMKRDGIEPPRRAPENCGPDEARLWKQADALASAYALSGGDPNSLSAAELRMLFHAASDQDGFRRWTARLSGQGALALARALAQDGQHVPAAGLITARVFAAHAADPSACDQAIAILRKAGTLSEFAQSRLAPGQQSGFYRPFASALGRAALPRHAYQAYCLAPPTELDKNDAWDFFRLCMTENDLFRAAQLLEKVQFSPEKTEALRTFASRAAERGHAALARRIAQLCGDGEAPRP